MFASFSDMIHQGTGILFLVVMAWFVIARKYLKDNPKVKNAANDAAKNTALAILARIFRK